MSLTNPKKPTLICAIAAQSLNNVIAIDGKIPWTCKADLAFFKKMTANSIVIMGRKTWESLPIGPSGKKLPGRTKIVISSNERSQLPTDIFVSKSLEDAVDLAELIVGDKPIFIIGGQQLYTEALEKCIPDVVYLSTIAVKPDIASNTLFFPKYLLADNYRLSQLETVFKPVYSEDGYMQLEPSGFAKTYIRMPDKVYGKT